MFTAREMGKVFFTNSGSEANDSQVGLLIEGNLPFSAVYSSDP
jgi:adenosylmethionine-8-amino-7-oxononanoate aminotransferase